MSDIIENPLKSISILYRKSHIWLNNSCAKYNLTAAQASIILVVCDYQVLTQDEITKKLGLDKSVIAKTITKLIKNEFITRKTNKKDKRTFDICPTDKAWAVYPFIKEQINNCFLHMTQHLSQQERKEFNRLLILVAQTTLTLEDE